MATGGRGAAQLAEIPRGASSRALLELRWEYPVYKTADEVRSTGTAPAAVRHALSREEALRFIAGNDPRPLLVLRECSVCNKTDDALLKGGPDNERTLVLSRWFHCVKLPIDVVEPDHPFNALFPNNEAEHLFVSLLDGGAKLALESDGSRTELWSSMEQVLQLAYEKSPAPTYADILKRFSTLDLLDFKVVELEAKKGLEMEGARPDRKKVEDIERDVASLKLQIDAEKAAIEKAFALVPKPKAAALAPAVPGKAVR